MANKVCEICGETWDTWQQGECPTCKSQREAELATQRNERLKAEAAEKVDEEFLTPFIDAVYREADKTDKRATSLDTFTNLLAALGILGGVIALFSGFTSSGGADALVIGAGIINILFWLLLRSFGVGIAARMNLAAAEARLRASTAEE